MSRRGKKSVPMSLFSFQDIITTVTGVMILVTLLLALELVRRKEGSPAARTTDVSDKIAGAMGDVPGITELISATDAKIKDKRGEVQNTAAGLKAAAAVDVAELTKRLEKLKQMDKKLAAEVHKEKQTLASLQPGNTIPDPELIEIKTIPLEKQIQDTADKLKEITSSSRIIYRTAPDDKKQAWIVQISGANVLAAAAGKSGAPRTFGGAAEFLDWTKGRDPATEWFVLFLRPSGVQAFMEVKNELDKSRFDVGYDVLAEKQVIVDPKKGAGI